MKKKKIASIIAGGTLVGSLMLSGNAYASTDTVNSRGFGHQNMSQNTEYPRRNKGANKQSNNFREQIEINTPRFIGTIQSINGSNFTITGAQKWNKHAYPFNKTNINSSGIISNSTSTYTVNTSNSTVYMKDGKLDTLNDLSIGQRVMIAGSLDSTMSYINANGINRITGTALPNKNGLRIHRK